MRIHEILTEFEHTAPPTEHGTFNNDPCTKPGCKGHIAGWRWARKHRMTNPDQCKSNNGHRSFWKGCWDNAAKQQDNKWQIHPAIRKGGKFVKTNTEKYHQDTKPKPDMHTTGY